MNELIVIVSRFVVGLAILAAGILIRGLLSRLKDAESRIVKTEKMIIELKGEIKVNTTDIARSLEHNKDHYDRLGAVEQDIAAIKVMLESIKNAIEKIGGRNASL